MSQVKVEASRDRVTIQEAAYRLGVKDDAIRKRIQRGTLQYEKNEDGRVYVFIDKTHDMSQPLSYDGIHHPTGNLSHDSAKDLSKDKIINVLEDQIQYLKEIIETRDRELEVRTDELKRKDTIIMSFSQRLPELSPPTSPLKDLGNHDGLVGSSGGVADEKIARESQTVLKRSWWRKLIGG